MFGWECFYLVQNGDLLFVFFLILGFITQNEMIMWSLLGLNIRTIWTTMIEGKLYLYTGKRWCMKRMTVIFFIRGILLIIL